MYTGGHFGGEWIAEINKDLNLYIYFTNRKPGNGNEQAQVLYCPLSV